MAKTKTKREERGRVKETRRKGAKKGGRKKKRKEQ